MKRSWGLISERLAALLAVTVRIVFWPSLLIAATVHAQAQLLSVGIKAGVPLLDAYNAEQTGDIAAASYTRRYLIGPTVELTLPKRFSIELDALYRRDGFETTGGYLSSTPTPFLTSVALSSNVGANDWQFPLLLKWRIPLGFGAVQPFVDGGVAYRHTGFGSKIQTSSSSYYSEHDQFNAGGPVIGGGVTFRTGPLQIAPEFRYAYWASDPYQSFSGIVTSTRNQADFLLGVTF